MSNKMKYYVIFDDGSFEVKSYDLLAENDTEKIVYGPCTAVTACIKADELEDEYISKNGEIDTRHYFEDIKYKSIKVAPLNECEK